MQKKRKKKKKVKFVYNIFRALTKKHIYLNAPKKKGLYLCCLLDDGWRCLNCGVCEALLSRGKPPRTFSLLLSTDFTATFLHFYFSTDDWCVPLQYCLGETSLIKSDTGHFYVLISTADLSMYQFSIPTKTEKYWIKMNVLFCTKASVKSHRLVTFIDDLNIWSLTQCKSGTELLSLCI